MTRKHNLINRGSSCFFIFMIGLISTVYAVHQPLLPKTQPASTTIPQGGSLDCRGGYGGRVFSTGAEIEIQIQPFQADFTDEIYLFSPVKRLLGTNRDVGKAVRFTFPAGRELVLGIVVRETGQTFRIGPSPGNPDGLFHALVTCLDNNTARVGFEDNFGGGDNDFDDAVLLLRTNAPPRCGVRIASSTASVEQSTALPTPTPEDILALTPQSSAVKVAQPPDLNIQQMQEQLQAVAPFVITDEQGMQQVLKKEARAAGVSNDALDLGHRLVGLNNRLIDAARKDKDQVPSFDAQDVAFIKPLFEYWAQFGAPEFNAPTPAVAPLRSQVQAQSSCGGFRTPTVCPPQVESGLFFSTKGDVTNHLISLGYHLTPRYATTANGFGVDFTRVVDDPCGAGTFRSEAVIRKQGDCWTYYTQSPEPNPEVLSYRRTWPYPWWPAYVWWYHHSFC